jgi:hypothetical protein
MRPGEERIERSKKKISWKRQLKQPLSLSVESEEIEIDISLRLQ